MKKVKAVKGIGWEVPPPLAYMARKTPGRR